MADYYTEKRRAYQVIDELFKDGKSEELITMKVQTMFGFGKKVVRERLEILASLSSKELKSGV